MWKKDPNAGWNVNPTKSEVLQRLDDYRTIEINNVWQRSAFLGTFLALGYTGYGFLVGTAISQDNVWVHFLACILACVNIIFSVLWIAMAKGSKAWYEVYENAILFVENATATLTWEKVRHELDLRRRKNETCRKCQNRNGCGFEDRKDDCLFSTRSGGYSPSKINIALGQIGLGIWIVVFFVHLVLLCMSTSIKESYLIYFFIKIISNVTIFVILGLVFSKWIKSSYFSD